MAARIDAELDLHGYTAEAARDQLDLLWSRQTWRGMRRVRIIHGSGEVLYKVVRRWADEQSIPWTVEIYNPGVTILQPALRRHEPDVPANRPFARYHEKLRSLIPPEPPNEAQPPDVATNPKPEIRNSKSPDLFALEMERLEKQDPRAIHKRKHGV